jgi:alkylresorcinol/alkylpyrone synthase
MTDDLAPSIAAAVAEFPPHRHSQADVIAALADYAGPEFHRFAAAAGVDHRNLALPLARYPELTGFSEANKVYLEVALELGERALLSALDKAGLTPSDVDVVFSTTVTGLAVPTLEARLPHNPIRTAAPA